ncbi:hypothetical protein H0H92_002857 [Tricholoma furcatifolium]|nr:hypothetical protein H0H92_002857 [Tricholoma furcatifolium]
MAEDTNLPFLTQLIAMPKPIILVTGVSGYVGSHVVVELLQRGYAVRGTARSSRLESLRSAACAKHPDFTLVHVEDIAKDDLTDVIKGRDASMLSAIDGTLNILRQAVEAGVTKIVITSSWGTMSDPSDAQGWEGIVFTSSHYGHATKEEVLSGKYDPLEVYLASKILAEQATWEFAASHPELDLTTMHPPFIYGPLAPGFPLPHKKELGTLGLLYMLLCGTFPVQVAPLFCDVRDVARAHVSALEWTGKAASGRKRYLVCGASFTWTEAVEHIQKVFPELKSRLPSPETAKPLPGKASTIDARSAAEDLGMVEYIGWHKTLEDAVKSLLEWEKASKEM